MSIESLKNALPDYAKDLKLNLGSLATEAAVSPELRAMLFVTAGLAVRQTAVREALVAELDRKSVV